MPKKLKDKKNYIEAVIFDFDGVILESSEIKTEAFLVLFQKYPEHQKAILEFHLKYQGVTRYKKFEWIYESLLNQKYTEEIGEKLGKDFSDIVYQKIMKASFVPGAKELLEFLKQYDIPAFIASGTPDQELKSIVHDRSLTHYFSGVYGSNLTKEEIIELIQKNRNFRSSKMLFIGDATTDYNAASAKELHFVARNTALMEEYWKEENVVTVNHLLEVPELYAFSKKTENV